LPSSDARFLRSTLRQPLPSNNIPLTHSMPVPPAPILAQGGTSFSPSRLVTGLNTDHEHALEFALRSWDLATGGLKTLTAKRELLFPSGLRSNADMMPDLLVTSRRYVLVLIVMVCIVLMLFGGGIVLFVMLQP
jgi:hypothetical protein